LTIVFDPQRIAARPDSYSWLDPQEVPLIRGIIIKRPVEEDNTVALSRNGGKWFVTHEGKDYPARQVRVEDFIAAFAKKTPYPVRSSNASSHERLYLTEDGATRITLSGGTGLPILDLLIGASDVTGQNAYLRKLGENTVRFGENRFTSYSRNTYTWWFNFLLFPETEDGSLDVTGIQRVTVYSPSEDGVTSLPHVITRRGREWTFNFELENPDMGKVDSYLRDVLNAAGTDFAEDVTAASPVFNYARIELQLGDGSLRSVRFGPPDENDRYFAAVSGSNVAYVIPAGTMTRLFPNFHDFGSPN
jgi:hypothetical protein